MPDRQPNRDADARDLCMLRDASCNWVDLLQVNAGEVSSVQFMCCKTSL